MSTDKQDLESYIEEYKEEMKRLFDEHQSTVATYKDLQKVCEGTYYVFLKILETLD